jgi:hypothetical protein
MALICSRTITSRCEAFERGEGLLNELALPRSRAGVCKVRNGRERSRRLSFARTGLPLDEGGWGNGRGDNLSAMKVIEHAADPKRFVASAASLIQARRPFARLDPQPHPEKLRPRHHRGRICLALARAQNASLGALRDAARTHRLRPRRGLRRRSLRGGLRSVQARLAAVVRYRRELPVGRDEGGRLDSNLDRPYWGGRLGGQRT